MSNLERMTDEELAMSYINGDNKAFDLLLSRNQTRLFSYIMFVVHDRETANDLFQETFVKVITKLNQGRYVTSGKFSAWIMRIAHNVIMDWFREQKAEGIVDQGEDNDLSNIPNTSILDDNIEDAYVRAQVLKDAKKIMEALPPSQREVVFMRFYQDLSFKEIAEMTGVSINTSLGRMRYAILNMRRMAKKHDIMLQMS